MIPGPEGPTTALPAQDSSDDTIELEFSDEERLALSQEVSQGVATVRPDEPHPMSSVPGYENFASRRVARIDLVCNVTCAVAALGISAVFLWPASNRHQHTPAAISTVALVTVTPPGPEVTAPAPAEPQDPPVRIKNAFDSTEVFEFPHGTTESEAREAVAALLLSRAHDRRAAGLALRRAANLQPNRGAAVQQSEAFVTKLVARVKEPLHGTD